MFAASVCVCVRLACGRPPDDHPGGSSLTIPWKISSGSDGIWCREQNINHNFAPGLGSFYTRPNHILLLCPLCGLTMCERRCPAGGQVVARATLDGDITNWIVLCGAFVVVCGDGNTKPTYTIRYANYTRSILCKIQIVWKLNTIEQQRKDYRRIL